MVNMAESELRTKISLKRISFFSYQVKCSCWIGFSTVHSSPMESKWWVSQIEIRKIGLIRWFTSSLGWPNAHSINLVLLGTLKSTMHSVFSRSTLSMKRFTSLSGFGSYYWESWASLSWFIGSWSSLVHTYGHLSYVLGIAGSSGSA